MRQIAVLNSDGYNTGEAEREVDRVKAIVISKSSGKVKAEDILGNQRDRESVEQTVSYHYLLYYKNTGLRLQYFHYASVKSIFILWPQD